MALSFPSPDLHALVWVSLVPLLAVLDGAPHRRCWWAGFLAGFVWRAVSLYWITHVMVLHGGMPTPMGVAVAGLLAVWMALNTGLVFLLAPFAVRRGVLGAAVFAAAWLSLEYLQTVLPFGFPWSLLGYAAGRSPAMMQAADLAGVWGLSFLAVFVNVAIAQRVVVGRRALASASVAAAAVIAVLIYGAAHLSGAPPLGEPFGDGESPAETLTGANSPPATLSVATVQGNVEQGRVWNPEALRSILDTHVRLSLQAVDADADLIMWSESSVPIRGGLEGDASTRAMLAQFARQHDTTMVVGSPHFDVAADGEGWVTNAAFLVRADGEWSGRYDKVHLVPWGEYVPVSWLFRFVAPLVDAIAGFRRGDRDQPLFSDESRGVPPLAMAICYEIVFPDHVRRQVARGATFIATITNDAWFGTTFAPYQHFAMARLRAVETRRYLVRAANTGLSGMVDPWGRVITRSSLNETALEIATIRPRTDTTPYVRWGDALPRLCVVLALVGSLAAWRARPGAPRPPLNTSNTPTRKT